MDVPVLRERDHGQTLSQGPDPYLRGQTRTIWMAPGPGLFEPGAIGLGHPASRGRAEEMTMRATTSPAPMAT